MAYDWLMLLQVAEGDQLRKNGPQGIVSKQQKQLHCWVRDPQVSHQDPREGRRVF